MSSKWLSSTCFSTSCHRQNMTPPRARNCKSSLPSCIPPYMFVNFDLKVMRIFRHKMMMNSVAHFVDELLLENSRYTLTRCGVLFHLLLKHLRGHKKMIVFSFLCSSYLRFSKCLCLCVYSVNIYTLRMLFHPLSPFVRRMMTSIPKYEKCLSSVPFFPDCAWE